MQNQSSCCCGGKRDRRKNCAVCGKPLIYFTEEKLLDCRLCHKRKPANAACEEGHLCPWDSLARILEWIAMSSSRGSS